MSREQGKEYVVKLERYLKGRTSLPTHNGRVNMSQIAKEAEIKYRTTLYENEGCKQKIIEACTRLGYPSPYETQATTGSSTNTYSQKELSEKDAKIKKLEERLVAEQNTVKELTQQVKDLEKRIKEFERSGFILDVLLDTGRAARMPRSLDI